LNDFEQSRVTKASFKKFQLMNGSPTIGTTWLSVSWAKPRDGGKEIRNGHIQ
jgi:hypothetical protein